MRSTNAGLILFLSALVEISGKAGDISRKKCEEYSKWMKSPGNDEWIAGQCGIDASTSILRGVQASKLEFPHMASVGFTREETEPGAIMWMCGGSLISENFVLTAGHCGYERQFKVSHVRLGDGDASSAQVIEVSHVHVHPEYSPKSYYDDISLLQLKTNVRFDDYSRPACLQQTRRLTSEYGIATGWINRKRNESSKTLMKADLPFINQTECSKIYEKPRQLERGVDYEIQLCAGGKTENDPACLGNSGAPLQIVQEKPHCMYSIVGILTFGRTCGVVANGYTRVSAYVPWIESIVWP